MESPEDLTTGSDFRFIFVRRRRMSMQEQFDKKASMGDLYPATEKGILTCLAGLTPLMRKPIIH